MRVTLLVVLGILLIGVAVTFRDTDLSVTRNSPVKPPSEEALTPSPIPDDQAGSAETSQAELIQKPRQSGLKDKSVVFPDGDVLEVNWRKHMRPTVVEYSVDNYEILREAALNGDAIVSIMLYEMQRNCQSRYENEDELEAAVDQLHQTHTIPIPGQEKSVRLADPESIERTADSMRSKYSRCEKLFAYLGNLEENWLERSANDGWPLAMVELGQQQQDQGSARNLYQAAWDAGSVHGLSLLSEIIKQSYKSGEDPTANVEAFAVLHTYTIIETTLLEDQGRIAGRHTAKLQAKLDEEQ